MAVQRLNDKPRRAARSLRDEGTLSGCTAKGVGSIVFLGVTRHIILLSWDSPKTQNQDGDPEKKESA